MNKSGPVFSSLLIILLLSSCRISDNEVKAYYILNEELETSIHLVDKQIKQDVELLKKLYVYSGEYFKCFYDKTLTMDTISNDLINNIQSIKNSLIELGGGVNENGLINKAKNRKIAYRFLKKNDRGIQLNKYLLKTQHDFASIMNDVEGTQDINEYTKTKIFIKPKKYNHCGLEIINDSTEKWVENYFKNVSLIAAISYLTSIQYDIMITQYNLEKSIINSIGVSETRVDSHFPVVKAEKHCLRANEIFKADIYLAKYDSKTNLDVFIEGKHHKHEFGIVVYKPNTSFPGSFRIPCHTIGTNEYGDTILNDTINIFYEVF